MRAGDLARGLARQVSAPPPDSLRQWELQFLLPLLWKRLSLASLFCSCDLQESKRELHQTPFSFLTNPRPHSPPGFAHEALFLPKHPSSWHTGHRPCPPGLLLPAAADMRPLGSRSERRVRAACSPGACGGAAHSAGAGPLRVSSRPVDRALAPRLHCSRVQ